jgi:hypothetical protein
MSAHSIAPQPDFAATEFMFNEVDEDFTGFAPTRILAAEPDAAPARPRVPGPKPVAKSVRRHGPKPVAKFVATPVPTGDLYEPDAMPPSWATVRWVEEQEALAAAAARRATAGNRVHRVLEPSSPRRAERLGWLARLEAFLQRVLPANLGSFLGLFACVALTMMLMSAVLPMVDRI